MTVTELLVVVVIIGLLSTMALPMFTKILEKAKLDEAINNLNLIAAGERIYMKEVGCYIEIPKLNIENPNAPSSYFEYTATDLGDNFEAEAVRKSGPYKDDKYIIRKDGNITGPLL